jgi:hypothetical protein
MKRLTSLILGAVLGVVLMGACLYVLASLWPRLAALWAAPTPIVVAVATETTRPVQTPAPTETAASQSEMTATAESPFLRELLPNATATVIADGPPGPSQGLWLPVTRLSLQSPYEAQGFDFQPTRLGDDRERWVAASPDGLALVEIVGAEQVEEASVTTFGPLNQNTDEGPRRAVYMLTLLNAVHPGWADGAEWFGDQLVRIASQQGDYASEVVHDGVRTAFLVDARLGAITLSFRPE